MPKLRLMFDRKVLREIPLGTGAVSIGRLPYNTVVIDNPAVSGEHARIRPEGDGYLVEDLDSRNGTFWNDQRVARHSLKLGDVILVGKHELVFVADSAPAAPVDAAAVSPASMAGTATVFLDTKANRERLARAAQAESAEAAGPAVMPPVAVAQRASLELVSGTTDRPEYPIEAQATTIGKAAEAQVRLRGWFKPATAAVLTHVGSRYVLTPVRGRVSVNGQRIDGDHDLNDGDLLTVSRVVLRFRLR
jgi:pSer/pThr/pTyr-binding forkhead associated (FHA) protein